MRGPRARLSEWRGRRQCRRYERKSALDELLSSFARAYPQATFIQIGANDGEQYDHLRPHILANLWRGVMVEPLPHVFERLSRNYAGLDRISLERAAIAQRDGQVTFHHLGKLDAGPDFELPQWYDAIGSISLETLQRNAAALPGAAPQIVHSQVPSLTFASLCEKHGIVSLDLLAIDTEGYDAQILAQLDLDRLRPRLIVYEHYHLAPSERRETAERLRDAGYLSMEEFRDTLCLLPADDQLTPAWRRLRPAVPGRSAFEPS